MAGNIEKREKNSYRLVCTGGYELNGKLIKHTKTIHGSKKDVQVELAKFVADIRNGLVIDGKSLKFTEFVEIVKRDYGSKELAPSTYKRYCRILETRLILKRTQIVRQKSLTIRVLISFLPSFFYFNSQSKWAFFLIIFSIFLVII